MNNAKKPVYIRCPRCELNYIQKKDKLCSVCKAELSANNEDYIDELDLELCPVCKTNYIQPDEIMCATCLKEHSMDGEIDPNSDWEEYIKRDEDEYIAPDEETGDMATVTDLDDEPDIIDDELAEDLEIDDEDLEDEEDDELGEDDDFDDEDEIFDDEEDD